MAARMTLGNRAELKQRLRDYALAHALDQHLTTPCRWALEGALPAEDHDCQGVRGAADCLCDCHDIPLNLQVHVESQIKIDGPALAAAVRRQRKGDDGQPVSAP